MNPSIGIVAAASASHQKFPLIAVLVAVVVLGLIAKRVAQVRAELSSALPTWRTDASGSLSGAGSPKLNG
ncbi:MAG TPA: hypothetical protein VHE61_10445 [Opitutaceae bacterium]|nr:hypothetical protein [Opitutaceae bacterium]